MDWRSQLEENEKKTKIVIATFFILLVGVGLLVDCALYLARYPVPLSVIFKALITFKLFPYATVGLFVFACISVLITFSLYDKLMLLGTRSYEVTAQNANSLVEKQLYNVVEEMKVASGMRYMPKVYLIQAEYMNAFASGYSEKSAMVAITQGLIEKLDRAELQAVMAHEISHIRHHDIKLTLTVSVLSNIMLMVIDMLFYGLLFGGNNRRNNREGGTNRLFLIVMIVRFTLPFFTVLLTLFLSRTREYMADAGAVELMRDNEPLARALMKITADHEQNRETYRQTYAKTPHESVRRASYIFDMAKFNATHDLSDFFSTHPAMSKRLKALGIKPQHPKD